MKIIPSVFSKPDRDGDFTYMMKKEEYNNSLFIFNDDINSVTKCHKGGGNACIRPYNKHNPNINIPRSAGIPTGSLQHGGFASLTEHVKKSIDKSIEEIKELVEIFKYDSIVYSAKKSGILGTGIFKVGKDVLQYITDEILKLEAL
jgi:hypothetical protein